MRLINPYTINYTINVDNQNLPIVKSECVVTNRYHDIVVAVVDDAVCCNCMV